MLDNLRQWFQKERRYGHEVPVALIQDFYQKYLDKAVVTVKLKLASTVAPQPVLEAKYKLLLAHLPTRCNTNTELHIRFKLWKGGDFEALP